MHFVRQEMQIRKPTKAASIGMYVDNSYFRLVGENTIRFFSYYIYNIHIYILHFSSFS